MFLSLLWLISLNLLCCYSRPSPLTGGSSLVKVKLDNFDQLVSNRQPDEVWIIIFHVSWCNACQKTLPEFAGASTDWKDGGEGVKVRFGEVDCTSSRNLREKFGIHSYPTIKIWTSWSNGGEEYTYNGIRSKEAITEYVSFMVRKNVQTVASLKEMEKQTERDARSSITIVSRDPEPSNLIEKVAIKMKDRHSFFILAPTDEALLSRIGSECDAGKETCIMISSPLESIVLPSHRHTPYYKVARLSEVAPSPIALEKWIDSNAFPGIWIVDESNSYNFLQGLQDSVIIAVDPTSKEQRDLASEKLLEANDNVTLAKQFRFGIVDGIYWSTTLSSLGMHQYNLPRVIVFKRSEFDVYWEDVQRLTVENLSQGLDEVVNGSLPSKDRRDNILLNRLANNLYYPARHFVSQSTLHLIGTLLTLLVVLIVVGRCVYETCGLIFIDDVTEEDQVEKIRAIAAERRKKLD